MSDLPGQMIRQEHVSIITCGQVNLLFEVDGISEHKLEKLTQEAERLEKSSSTSAFYMDRQKEKRKRGAIITCDTAGRLRRRTLFELGGIPERKLDKSAQEAEGFEKSSLEFTFHMDSQNEEWERGVNIACSKKESFTDKWHYIITDTPGHRDFIKSSITSASQADVAITVVSADGNFTTEIAKATPSRTEDHRSSGAAGLTKMRKLWFAKNLKEPFLEEDEAENGYQKDTQENNVPKASNANGTLYVLDFELSVILATFVRYI